jgi:hypothetical protein
LPLGALRLEGISASSSYALRSVWLVGDRQAIM